MDGTGTTLMGPVLAVTTTAVGVVASNVGAMLSSAGTSGGPAELAPYLSGGGTVAAVGGLVWVAKKLISGDLVPRPVAEYQSELSAVIGIQGEREGHYMKLVEQQQALIKENIEQQSKTTRALWESNVALGHDPRGPRE